MDAIEILFDGNRGIYIPQHFAQECGDIWTGFNNEDVAILLDGPENEEYWDTWASVLDYAEFTDGDDVYTLHQDGDLFAICVERMTPTEYRDFFGEEPDKAFYENYAERNNLSCYVLPEHWASALINDDLSGLSDEEKSELVDFTYGLGFCVDVSQAWFDTHSDTSLLAGDVACFLFQK